MRKVIVQKLYDRFVEEATERHRRKRKKTIRQAAVLREEFGHFRRKLGLREADAEIIVN